MISASEMLIIKKDYVLLSKKVSTCNISFKNRTLDLAQLPFCGKVKAGFGYPICPNISYSIWQ